MNNIEIYNINKFQSSFINNNLNYNNPIQNLIDSPAYNTDNINNLDPNYFNDSYDMKYESDKISCNHLNSLNDISYNNYDQNFLSNFKHTDISKPFDYNYNKEHSILKGESISHKKFYDKIDKNGPWIDMFDNKFNNYQNNINIFNQYTKKKSI